MSIPSSIAIYFIIWWICLFVVLPFGVRNAHETGLAVEAGNEHGAPVHPMIGRKVVVTTILAAILFALVWYQMTYGLISFDDIPFLSGMPKE